MTKKKFLLTTVGTWQFENKAICNFIRVRMCFYLTALLLRLCIHHHLVSKQMNALKGGYIDNWKRNNSNAG